jgi:hypothetical protein
MTLTSTNNQRLIKIVSRITPTFRASGQNMGVKELSGLTLAEVAACGLSASEADVFLGDLYRLLQDAPSDLVKAGLDPLKVL